MSWARRNDSLPRRSTRGLFDASSATRSSTAASRSADGTTRLTSPHRAASSAVTPPARQHHLQGELARDVALDHGADHERPQPHVHLGGSHLRGICRDDQVARHRQSEPPRQRVPVHPGDHGLRVIDRPPAAGTRSRPRRSCSSTRPPAGAIALRSPPALNARSPDPSPRRTRDSSSAAARARPASSPSTTLGSERCAGRAGRWSTRLTNLGSYIVTASSVIGRPKRIRSSE